jgi:hypothetical protein
VERAVYFDAWFPRQHCYHPSLPPRRLRMVDDLVDYRATMLVWSALVGGSLSLPYLEQRRTATSIRASASSSHAATHLAEHRSIVVDPLPEQRQQLLLGLDESPERGGELRRRQHVGKVSRRRQVPRAGHLIGHRLELYGDAALLLDQSQIDVALAPRILVVEIERLRMCIEHRGQRGGELSELRGKRGVRHETLTTCRLLDHADLLV